MKCSPQKCLRGKDNAGWISNKIGRKRGLGWLLDLDVCIQYQIKISESISGAKYIKALGKNEESGRAVKLRINGVKNSGRRELLQTIFLIVGNHP